MESLRDLMGLSSTSRRFDFDDLKKLEQLKVDSVNKTEGTEHIFDNYSCTECRNKGFVMKLDIRGDRVSSYVSKCKCIPVRRSIRLMQKSGLQHIIRDCTFERFKATEDWQKAMLEKAKAFAKEPIGWFMLAGQSGAGKTMLCTAICREFLLQGVEVAYMAWREESAALKAIGMDVDTREMRMDRFKNAPVLYIDDLWKTGWNPDGTREKPTPADERIAFEILNHRYNNPALITLVSTEWRPEELIGIEQATAGRILERVGDNVVDIARDIKRNHRLKGVVTV